MDVNAAGNFETRQGNGGPGGGGQGKRFSAPYRVRVTDGTNSRAMAGSLTNGDCNSCHTKDGANGAPGRILFPVP